MDSTPEDGNKNHHTLDSDEVPIKKRKLSDKHDSLDSFGNDTQEHTSMDTQEYILLSDDDGDETSVSNRNDFNDNKVCKSNSTISSHDNASAAGATAVLDDIFNGITKDITAYSCLTNSNEDSVPFHHIDVSDNNQKDISSDGIVRCTTTIPDQKKSDRNENCAIRDALDRLLSTGDKKDNAVIVIDDSSAGDGAKKSLSEGPSKNDTKAVPSTSNRDVPEEDSSSNSDAGLSCIKKVPSLVNDAKTILSIIPSANYLTTYKKLLEYRHDENRLQIVTASLLEASPKKEDGSSYLAHTTPEHDAHEKGSVASELSSVRKVPSLTRDAKIISSIVPNVNYNIIYNKLLENRDNGNRLDIVTASLLEASPEKKDNSSKPENSIIEDVQFVVKQFPTADADMVYACLESIENESDRVERTIKEMGLRKADATNNNSDKKPDLIKKDSTLIDDPVLANDPLFNDMRKLGKVFPDRDRNEIYALLEAHVDKGDRIQLVMNELLNGNSQNDVTGTTNSNPTTDSVSNDIPKEDVPASIDLTDVPDILPEQEDVEHLLLLFPDCDPNYLYEKIEAMKAVADRRNVLAAEMFEKKTYPKLKDRLEKERLEEEKKKTIKRNFTVAEFLNKFPDPQTTFGDPTKPVSDLYKQHSKASMLNDYLMFKADYLTKTLEEHNFHYYVASKKVYDVLVQTPVAERRLHRRFMKTRRKKLQPVPTENDEYFFHEHWFAHNELNIEDYKKQKVEERQAKVEEAREKGELYECCCCFDDECLFEDLANCPEGHLFCKVCVVRSTEAAFGEMKTRFSCLTGECDQDIPLSTLQGIVPPNLFSKIVSRLQEEEVLQAQIPDLVTCPFCPFATVMPNEDDKVLKCLNPECLKESCRLCQEESHIPLKCSEVESKAGTKMRTYIENKVAEAVMRKCHKCGKRFLKDTGCNKMTCICGATSCYNCKEIDIDYGHFNGSTKCAQTDPNVIHDRDMKEAAKKAMEEYLLAHPEASDLDLQSDLKDVIKNYETNSQQNNSINALDLPEPSSESEDDEPSDAYYDSSEDGYGYF